MGTLPKVAGPCSTVKTIPLPDEFQIEVKRCRPRRRNDSLKLEMGTVRACELVSPRLSGSSKAVAIHDPFYDFLLMIHRSACFKLFRGKGRLRCEKTPYFLHHVFNAPVEGLNVRFCNADIRCKNYNDGPTTCIHLDNTTSNKRTEILSRSCRAC